MIGERGYRQVISKAYFYFFKIRKVDKKMRVIIAVKRQVNWKKQKISSVGSWLGNQLIGEVPRVWLKVQ
jgi:hypothetical protein